MKQMVVLAGMNFGTPESRHGKTHAAVDSRKLPGTDGYSLRTSFRTARTAMEGPAILDVSWG